MYDIESPNKSRRKENFITESHIIFRGNKNAMKVPVTKNDISTQNHASLSSKF